MTKYDVLVNLNCIWLRIDAKNEEEAEDFAEKYVNSNCFYGCDLDTEIVKIEEHDKKELDECQDTMDSYSQEDSQ